MDHKQAPDAVLDAPTDVERLPSPPFTPPVRPSFERPWWGRHARGGEVVDGRFQLGERLRGGPTGDLFAATHLSLQRRVAVFVLRPESARDGVLCQRLERAALALAAVEQRNLVRVLDLGRDDPPFVVFERPAGPSLAELIARGGPFGATRAVRIARQLAAALRAMHAHGVVHGAVGADNVVIVPPSEEGEAETAKLGGFAFVATPPDVTLAAPDVGEAELDLAPTIERADGVRGDLVALVSLLRRMLDGDGARALDRAALRARLAREVGPVSADRLARLLERGPAGEARSRIASAAELEEALGARSSPAAPPRARRPPRPVRRWLLISVAAVVISGLMGFVCARRWGATDHPETHERGSR